MDVKVLDIVKVAVVLLALDMIYLTLTSKHYKNLIMKVQGQKLEFRILPAIIAYILLIIGVYYFIIKQKRSVIEAIVLGLVIYGVYEGTNYAIIKDWDLKTFLMDGLWGGILFGVTTYVVYKLM